MLHCCRLCIVSNEVNGLGLCNLAESLRKMNTTLAEVYVWGNNLEESCCIVSINWPARAL